jgi:hypothetical protein
MPYGAVSQDLELKSKNPLSEAIRREREEDSI